ncbi:GNAT family N-acetyltransferase [Thalassotalea sp. 1_MG-2023]|uniref:GNAT family N-acetyltransferase n=1 Tax=Thalassotalea sp. 1_MG-2023 TaxID=3062680 RepID=UPI0026E25F0C|nr:GNAT family N-acetyltransferase [Thalassotalea sp. 1_MG-2023]MDO6428287.1 GNAT family N-acetyltransferase [Thalassotalea sp. 1_MG-2023]
MKLTTATQQHIPTIMAWFPDEQALSLWSGPGFRYPFTERTFIDDLKLSTLSSYALINENGEIVAFGQFYLRMNRCHLGRLVVKPSERGKGIATMLIQQLSEIGCKVLNTSELSLFVFTHNTSATRAYQKLGFVLAQYSEPMPIENCVYMIKKN